jgi:hypothetical protein
MPLTAPVVVVCANESVALTEKAVKAINEEKRFTTMPPGKTGQLGSPP